MHNGTPLRRGAQFTSGQHLVRFYFLTRALDYLEDVLEELQSARAPPGPGHHELVPLGHPAVRGGLLA